MRYLRVPLERARVPLVARVPQFENHCSRGCYIDIFCIFPC